MTYSSQKALTPASRKVVTASARASARSSGWRSTSRSPAPISLRSRAPAARGSGFGSRKRISASVPALSTYDPASIPTARAAPSTPTRKPPALGPAISAIPRAVFILPVASTSRSRPTSSNGSDAAAASKTTVSEPTTTATT